MKPNHDYLRDVTSYNVAAAKARFLDSMGLGENSLRELAESGYTREAVGQVVLSSQPDDMELPGANNKNVSIRVQSSGDVEVSATGNARLSAARLTETAAEVLAEQSVPALEAAIPEAGNKVVEEAPLPEEPCIANEAPDSEETSASVYDSDDFIHLNCPKCDEEVAFRPEYVGIDGSCVWCGAGIVASRDADGELKIYPFFQPGVITNEEEANEGEPALAPATEPTPPEEGVANAPKVTSRLLGKKPQKTVRRGFIVMLVIILGFVCGAALASYVLPVDEYVAKARSVMDKKFNPGSVIEMAPTVPTAPPANPSSPASEMKKRSQKR